MSNVKQILQTFFFGSHTWKEDTDNFIDSVELLQLFLDSFDW